MLRLLLASDMHSKIKGPNRLEDIVNLVNYLKEKEKIDAIFLLGDFREGAEYIKFLQENFPNEIKKTNLNLNQHEFEALRLYLQFENYEDLIKALKDQPNIKYEKEIEDLIKIYFSYLPTINRNKEKFKQIKQDLENKKFQNYKNLEKIILNQASEDIKILKNSKVPVFGVRGNHDTDQYVKALGDAKAIEWLDLESNSLKLKNLKFAAASNTFEILISLDENFYKSLEPAIPLKFYYENKDKIDIKNVPSYQRLKDQNFDVLLLHKGLHGFASYMDWDVGIDKIVAEKKPKIIFCGHGHTEIWNRNYGYDGFQASNNKIYLIEIDLDNKNIKNIVPYRYTKP